MGKGVGVDYAAILLASPLWILLSRGYGIGELADWATVLEVVADLDNDIGLIADPFKNPGGIFTRQIY